MFYAHALALPITSSVGLGKSLEPLCASVSSSVKRSQMGSSIRSSVRGDWHVGRAAITVACVEEDDSDDSGDNAMVPRSLGSLHAVPQTDSAWTVSILQQAVQMGDPDCSDHCVSLPPAFGSSLNG